MPHQQAPKRHIMKTAKFLHVGALALGFVAATMQGVRAETAQLRIAQQFGIAYLPLIVASERGLIEEEAKVLGITPRRSNGCGSRAPRR
jgi:NitT/TauT family transport system substrate-binding protein